jgi:hypothetical protein
VCGVKSPVRGKSGFGVNRFIQIGSRHLDECQARAGWRPLGDRLGQLRSDFVDMAGQGGWADGGCTLEVGRQGVNATWARLHDRSTGREFLFLNTHFDHRGVQARIRSAAAIKAHLTGVHAATPLPILVTGDLNVEPTSEAFAALTAGGFLRDARPADYSQPTSLGFEVNSARVSIIDYILHNAGFAPDAFQVITDHDGRYFPSDHLPVVARVAFAPGP